MFYGEKKRCFQSGFTVTLRVSQRCLSGYKKGCLETLKKRCFHSKLTVIKGCLDSVSIVRKNYFDGAKKEFPQGF